MDNIFSNATSVDAISGNLTAAISDHLPQFMMVPHVFSNLPSSKPNVYEKDRSNFDQVNFILGYFSIDWDDALKINEKNIDYSTKAFLNKSTNYLIAVLP